MAVCFAALTVFPRSQAAEQGAASSLPHVKGQMKPKRTAVGLLRSPAAGKVFEDRAAGIVCYEDERGEVVCEGFDEGPRCSSPCASPERDRQRDVPAPPGVPRRIWTMPSQVPRVLRVNGFTHRPDNC